MNALYRFTLESSGGGAIEGPNPCWSEIWKAIGGARGLMKMHLDSAITILIVPALARVCPPDSTRLMLWAALRFWMASLACLTARLAGFRPASAALRCARLYYEIGTSREMLEEFLDRCGNVAI